jgi:hypothetical protein
VRAQSRIGVWPASLIGIERCRILAGLSPSRPSCRRHHVEHLEGLRAGGCTKRVRPPSPVPGGLPHALGDHCKVLGEVEAAVGLGDFGRAADQGRSARPVVPKIEPANRREWGWEELVCRLVALAGHRDETTCPCRASFSRHSAPGLSWWSDTCPAIRVVPIASPGLAVLRYQPSLWMFSGTSSLRFEAPTTQTSHPRTPRAALVHGSRFAGLSVADPEGPRISSHGLRRVGGQDVSGPSGHQLVSSSLRRRTRDSSSATRLHSRAFSTAWRGVAQVAVQVTDQRLGHEGGPCGCEGF